MEDKELSKKILISKAKIMADRNARFAVIKKEVAATNYHLTNRLNELSHLIKEQINKS